MIEVKEHGIYERRDGVIVPWMETYGLNTEYRFRVGSEIYNKHGQFSSREHSYDLVREIVVGPGWMPHNGGENPAPGKFVDIITRNGWSCGWVISQHVDWSWTPGDEPSPHIDEGMHIVAWRLTAEAKEDRLSYR